MRISRPPAPLSGSARAAARRADCATAGWLLVALLAPLLVAGGAQAQQRTIDPIKSPACAQALAALDQVRADGAPSAQQKEDRVESYRQQASIVCLGLNEKSARKLPRAQTRGSAPMAVSPPRVVLPPAAEPAAPAAAEPSAATALPRPPTYVTTCDAGGCWDSNGLRLERAGPNLVGPSGLCTVQGTLINCP